jgi:acyl-coenzyme A synthetase/AMP-(fatty) acid ligase
MSDRLDVGCDWSQDPFLGELLDLATGQHLGPDELRSRVRSAADNLRDAGVLPGHVVSVANDQPLDSLIAVLGAWQVGACIAILDPMLSQPETANVQAFLRPKVHLASCLLPIVETPRTMSGTGLDAPALILLTSGTTGQPKAVVHSHRGLLARIALNRAFVTDATLARTLLTLPLHFGHGLIGNALTALFSGGRLVLAARGLGLAANLGPIVDRHAITFFSSVPSFWHLVLRTSAPPTGRSLQRVHVGSAPLSTELWSAISDWCQAEVANCYGITETANWIGGQPALGTAPAPGAVGRPWGGSYAVRDQEGKVQFAGAGEVLVRSPSMMIGYLDLPDLTHSVLSDGWYATGDTGVLSPEGALTLSGRIKDEINRAGQKIQPADIDLVLEAHPEVEEACSFGMPDPLAGEIVAAALVTREGSKLDVAQACDWCRERLRPAAVPQRWFFVDALPRTSRGKISRAVVRDSVSGR